MDLVVLRRCVQWLRRHRRLAGGGLVGIVVGAVVGLCVGLVVPAHLDIAGSDAAIVLRPRLYDQLGVRGVVEVKRTTTRAVLGQPLGVGVTLDLDASQLVNSKGEFNTDVLPAYIQAYSDPAELIDQIRSALIRHLVAYTAGGAVLASLLMALVLAYRRWRSRVDRRDWPGGTARVTALAYRAPERALARRVVVALLLLVVIGSVRSGDRHAPAPAALRAAPIFDGTPLEGAEVDGLLRPALTAAQDYVRRYFGQTDTYYDNLDKALAARLETSDVDVPTGQDVVPVGFVTDRHCNTGMDRVVISLMKHFGVQVLVSGGDDDFSGSFSFESACTSGLAGRIRSAGITGVFVAGNHDSAQTIANEQDEGLRTLTGDVVTVDGLHLLGSPDPRTSRYGQGIRPASSAAQHAVTTAQGRAVARTACDADGPIIAVLHDPNAGDEALEHGCGHVTLALDGHTHAQAGPTAHALPGGATGHRFTGASSGGAPTENDVERTFASRLTVGPLNHDATVNIASVDRSSGALIAMTEFRFTPDGTISITQQRTG